MSVSSSRDPVDAITDLLEAASTDTWTNTRPEIYRLDTTTPAARQNQTKDTLYVRQLTDMSLERFGVDPGEQDEQTETGSVQVEVHSLTEGNAQTLARDVIGYLKTFMSDNYTKTAFLFIEPETLNDGRISRVTRQTDHYIYQIDLTTERLD